MKLLASDFDGTLFFDKGEEMKEKDLAAIRRFQNEGNLFGICTGRNLKGIIEPTKNRVRYDFYVLNSGAIILDEEMNVIHKKMITKDIAKKIISLTDKDIEITLIMDEKFYAINLKSDWEVGFAEIDSVDELEGNEFEAISFHFDTLEKTSEVMNNIMKKYGDIVEVFQNVTNLDFAPKGCSKGNALRKVKEHYNIDDNDMNCIGDSWNDLPMFKEIQNSFTFTYSPEDVQKETKHIINNLGECISIILDKK